MRERKRDVPPVMNAHIKARFIPLQLPGSAAFQSLAGGSHCVNIIAVVPR
jgi:hypothetical protein